MRLHFGFVLAAMVACTLVACGGGGGGSGGGVTLSTNQEPYRVSGDSPHAPGCGPAPTANGAVFVNSEVEPFVAVDPTDPKVLLGAWQQDRWEDGGAKGLVIAVSLDGGASWTRKAMPFSACGGGNASNNGEFERASDPWVDIGADRTMYAMGLAANLSGASNSKGFQNAMVVSRSTDQGRTWSTPVVLRGDGTNAFNDKNSLTVSTVDPRKVFAVWDRAEVVNMAPIGPLWLARSLDAGATWQAAKKVYTPATGNALGNRIVVLRDGTLVDVFNSAECDPDAGSTCRGSVQVIRSKDDGDTWSPAITVSENYGVPVAHPVNNTPLRAPALPSIAVGPDDKIWITWHDARFSQTGLNSIALSSSSDGGLTWTEPVAIQKDTSTNAFMPSITVAKDGTIAVSHYDFRGYASDRSKKLTNAWLLTSKDGKNWVETKIRGTFDVGNAPDVGGLFLGDYQGLVSVGTAFMPFYTQANPEANNRTDIYAIPIKPLASAAYQARSAPALPSAQRAALQSQAGQAMQDWLLARRQQQRRQP